VTAKPRRGKGNFSTAEAVRARHPVARILRDYRPVFRPDRQAQNAVPKIAPLSPSNGGESAHRVASIVVETDKKGRCEERRFDNRSGKIVAATVVDCEARLADERDASPSENLSAERMRAILGAFRR
ncbi:MAG: hypothetical protein WB686_05215, partial [Pseudolabrys sp.]